MVCGRFFATSTVQDQPCLTGDAAAAADGGGDDDDDDDDEASELSYPSNSGSPSSET